MKLSKTKLDLKLKKIIPKYKFSINDEKYLNRIFKEGLTKYEARLNAIGFNNYQKILDAGCGFGQWSLTLSSMGKEVSGCDISPFRINFLRDLVTELSIKNIDIQLGKLNKLPYENSTFDAIFCYGVIFLTPWRQSLLEMTRVLRPGGAIYISANDVGWYLFLWQKEHNKTIDYDPKLIASKSLYNTLNYERNSNFTEGMNLIIEQKKLEKELIKLRYEDIVFSNEGGLHLDKLYSPPVPFYKNEYIGINGVYEVVANKLK
jgi:ubiquinone/menaquinone biosynthesis C-methylase UbiE